MKTRLTSENERVLAFIRSFQLREGVSPTRQEIADGLKLPNLMAAQRAVLKLREHGRLIFDPQSKRGIELVESESESSEANDVIKLPLLGTVAAGRPIEAIEVTIESALESARSFSVPRTMIQGSAPHFVLQVKGDSMIEDHICDGDFVIVRQQSSANNGEKVIALINGEATLKRFYRKERHIELHPANASLKPIIVEAHQHLRIAGIFAGLIRVQK